jgi:predicted nucleic acid-binding protein
MKVFFDTSVLVAALFEGHASHQRAFPWLRRALDREFSFAVATHTLAELYSVLTSLPVKPKIHPAAARELIQENVESVAELISLSPEDYSMTLQRLAELGLPGGGVFDALLARAAEKSGADRLLTFNAKDFRRVWPAGESILFVPE